MKRYTQFSGTSKATCRAKPFITPFLNETEVVCGEPIERLAELENKIESGEVGNIKRLTEKIDALFSEHEKRYSHFCKSKKECHDETCRYQAVVRLHNELKEILNHREEWEC